MLSVTTLRNLKKELTKFLFISKEREIEALREQLMDEKQRLKEVIRSDPASFAIDLIDIEDDGTITALLIPHEDVEPYKRIQKLNSLIDKKEDEFAEKVTKIHQWFTLAEASSILNIPEMPEWIKELLDKMIENLR